MKLRNHRIVASCLAGAIAISIDIQAFAANEGGVHLILPNAFNPEDCITSEERVIAQKAIDAYRQAHPERAGADTADSGERVAQLVIAPVIQAEIAVVDTLPETERGAGGFGSTGTH